MAGNIDESDFEGRTKNVLDGLGCGILAEGVFTVARSLRLARKARGAGRAALEGEARAAKTGGAGETLDGRPSLDAAGKKAPPIVDVDPSAIPVPLDDTKTLRGWLKKRFQGTQVVVADDGSVVQFTGTGLKDSAKRRGVEQRQAYAWIACWKTPCLTISSRPTPDTKT